MHAQMTKEIFTAAALVFAVATGPLCAAEQVMEGELKATDPVLAEDNTHYHEYFIEAREGDFLTVDLMSDAFDAYLTVVSPSGRTFDDDDGGDGQNSRRNLRADHSGRWKIVANTVSAGETGRYQLRIRTIPADQLVTENHRGRLRNESLRSPVDGAPYAEYRIRLAVGDMAVVGLDSADFDAVLHAHAPSGAVISDDDDGGDTNSLLTIRAEESGEWRIVATTLSNNGRGDYDLSIGIVREQR